MPLALLATGACSLVVCAAAGTAEPPWERKLAQAIASGSFVNTARAMELLHELQHQALQPQAVGSHSVVQPDGANVTFERPVMVGSDANTKFWFPNNAFTRANITTLVVSQGLDGYPCPPIKAVTTTPGRETPQAKCVMEALANCSGLWRTFDGGRSWSSLKANSGMADFFLPSLPGAPAGWLTAMSQGDCDYTSGGKTDVSCHLLTYDTANPYPNGSWPLIGNEVAGSQTGPMVIIGLPQLKKTAGKTVGSTSVTTETKALVVPGGKQLVASLVIAPAGGECANAGTLECTSIVIITSSDRSGKSWTLQGAVPPSDLNYGRPLHFGCQGKNCDAPDEHDLALLPDGQLLVVARTGSPNPLFMARSANLGKTWTRYPYPIAWSVYPRLLRLSNGAVLLSSGRPGIGLWVSSDGHGDEWTYHNIAGEHNLLLPTTPPSYTQPFATLTNWSFCGWSNFMVCNRSECLSDGNPSGANPRCTENWEMDQATAYTSLSEVEPNVALLTYDRLAYGWDYPPGPVHAEDAVFAMRIAVERGTVLGK